ncbi:uncharacterized protein RSE6_06728 [Rhynchosporium secalis]|uniref:Uncharacterized protein n=1 Tax=Rhynchosporium secalis TaxID=38038 RepID=A0A1E1MB25_RHYSE|nr:uncharacterized protein RSE6_06728 [Rhynchosporium secalis]
MRLEARASESEYGMDGMGWEGKATLAGRKLLDLDIILDSLSCRRDLVKREVWTADLPKI